MKTSRWERFSTAELDTLYTILTNSMLWSNIKDSLRDELSREIQKRRQELFFGGNFSNTNWWSPRGINKSYNRAEDAR